MIAKILLLSLILRLGAGFSIQTTMSSLNDEDYYWREYIGKIPSDALVGGKDEEGRATYIGKIIYENVAIIGEINDTSKTLSHVYMGKVYIETKGFEILCVGTPELYQWVNNTAANKSLLMNKQLIFVNYFFNEHCFIGRKEINGKVTVGSVYFATNSLWMYIGIVGQNYAIDELDFQILSINLKRDTPESFQEQ